MATTDDNALLHNKIQGLVAELESTKKREEDMREAMADLISIIESAGGPGDHQPNRRRDE